MVRAAQFVNGIHQYVYVLRVDAGVDAVAEVEHVPVAPPEPFHDVRDLVTNALR